MLKAILISLIILIVIGLLGAGAGFVWLQNQLTAINPNNTEETIFVIRRGQGTNSIADELFSRGFIRHPLLFKYIVYTQNLGGKIQAGSFKLNQSMTASQIAIHLTKGSLDMWVTLIEGWRREEYAEVLKTAMDEQGRDFSIDTFLDLTKDKEGYLFPDTYLIPLDADEARIISILTNTFNTRIESELSSAIDASPYSLEQIVIMASLIEREARSQEARNMVSGILWNRLENDWPLQVDATLQYPKGFDSTRNTWWPTPMAADKDIVSPYNTYANQGLPPAPICNPSISSLKAAATPQRSSYWFYITGNDNKMYYAETLDQHNDNIRQHLR